MMQLLPSISNNSSSRLTSSQRGSSHLLSVAHKSQSNLFQPNQSLLSCIDNATGRLYKWREHDFLNIIGKRFSGNDHSKVLEKECPNEYLCNIAVKLLSSSRCNSKQTSLSKTELPGYKCAMALLYYLTSLGHLRSCYTLAEKLNDQKSLKAFAYYGKYICLSIGIQPIPAEASLAKAVLIEALSDPYSRRDALRALAKVEATQISQDKKDKHFSGEYLNKLVKSRDPYFYNFVEKMKKNDAVRLYLDTIEQSRYNHRCFTTSSGNPTILVKKNINQ